MAEAKYRSTRSDVENSLLRPNRSRKQISLKHRRSCLCKCCIITGIISAVLLLLAFLLIFVVIPVAIMNSVEVQRSLIFMPYRAGLGLAWTTLKMLNQSQVGSFPNNEFSSNVATQCSINTTLILLLERPRGYATEVTGPQEAFENVTEYVNGSRNFYVNVNQAENITLGVWHFLPAALVNESIENVNFNYSQSLAQPDYPVLVHFHGNGGTRWDNLLTLLILRQFFHIVAFDYRGYGDSSKAELTEEGIVQDSIQFYKWLQSQTAPDNIYVWGHSLGSALATHALARLKKENIAPMGLILEAPFTTLREAIEKFYLSKIFSWLPWFGVTMLDGFEKNGFNFKTTENILRVDCPILILHAEDDVLISYTLGEKLYKIAQEKRDPITQGKVTFHLFPAKLEYNHWGITEAPELSDYLRNFMNICEEYSEDSKKNDTRTRH